MKTGCSQPIVQRKYNFSKEIDHTIARMKLNKSNIIFGCLMCLIFVLATAQAQDTTPATTTTSENGLDGRTPAPLRPGSLLRLLYHPLRMSMNSARRFLSNRIENVHNVINMTRLQTYKMFMSLYNKTYSPEELPRRMALFFKRRDEIEQSIKAFMEGKSSFAMKENAFTDWDDSELKKLTGVSLPSLEQLEEEERDFSVSSSRLVATIDEDDDDPNITVHADPVKIPASKDWSQSGCVSTPINQKDCGACYAIATMSVVESMKCIKKDSSPILSPQQIVDCATPRAGYQNYGCNGGWPTRVLKYLQDEGAAAREKCYPFVRRQQTCKLRQVSANKGCVVSASPVPGQRIQYKVLHNERDILYHVANTGPVVTVMKASDKFLYYGKGIFDDPKCSNRRDDVDHAIVITGYGKENGVDYWLIKNSWGVSEWGIDGYAKYLRNKNACSIGHWGWVVNNQ